MPGIFCSPLSAAAGRPSRVTVVECGAEVEEGELQLLSSLPQPGAGMHRGAGRDIVRRRGRGVASSDPPPSPATTHSPLPPVNELQGEAAVTRLHAGSCLSCNSHSSVAPPRLRLTSESEAGDVDQSSVVAPKADTALRERSPSRAKEKI